MGRTVGTEEGFLCPLFSSLLILTWGDCTDVGLLKIEAFSGRPRELGDDGRIRGGAARMPTQNQERAVTLQTTRLAILVGSLT